MKLITILGSTGSIGTSTLDVISRHPDRFGIYALSGHRNVELLLTQTIRYQPKYIAMTDPESAKQLSSSLCRYDLPTKIIAGDDACTKLASMEEVDVVVAGMVGSAGLLPVLAACRKGKTVLIANKEPLVMMGAEIIREAGQGGAKLLPVDSEHNAIFQCLQSLSETLLEPDFSLRDSGVAQITLTASGGPFLRTPREQFASITPVQACAHPNWVMGNKISIDSATLMNKGLEYIEAFHLFSATAEQLSVLIHPQSIVHSLVQFRDGSQLAQLSLPDMRIPIAHCLAHPERIPSGAKPLNLAEIGRLDFEFPDESKFRCLTLAKQACITSGTAPAILNAANEMAVAAFLQQRIRFNQIAEVVEETLNRSSIDTISLDSVLAATKYATLTSEKLCVS